MQLRKAAFSQFLLLKNYLAVILFNHSPCEYMKCFKKLSWHMYGKEIFRNEIFFYPKFTANYTFTLSCPETRKLWSFHVSTKISRRLFPVDLLSAACGKRIKKKRVPFNGCCPWPWLARPRRARDYLEREIPKSLRHPTHSDAVRSVHKTSLD